MISLQRVHDTSGLVKTVVIVPAAEVIVLGSTIGEAASAVAVLTLGGIGNCSAADATALTAGAIESLLSLSFSVSPGPHVDGSVKLLLLVPHK